MRQMKKSINGFTLIELIITLSILGIVIVFMSQILNFNIRFVKHEDKRIEYAQNARIAANAIMDKVSMADAANVIYNQLTKSIEIAGTRILDTTERTTAPTPTDIQPGLWFYRQLGSTYGELMDNNGKVVAQYIRDLQIRPSGNYINVSIGTGELADAGNKNLNLSIPLKVQVAAVIDEDFPVTPTTGNSVGGYTFNQYNSAGHTILDTSGNGVDLTYESKVGPNSPVFGVNRSNTPGMSIQLNMLNITNNESYLWSDNAITNAIVSTLTIDLWCKPQASGNAMTLVDRRNGNVGFRISIDSSNRIVFYVNGYGAGSSLVSGDDIIDKVVDGQWNHIKVTLDANASSNNMKIYMGDNLALVSSLTKSRLNAANNDYILMVGRDIGGNYYQGELDSLFISDILM